MVLAPTVDGDPPGRRLSTPTARTAASGQERPPPYSRVLRHARQQRHAGSDSTGARPAGLGTLGRAASPATHGHLSTHGHLGHPAILRCPRDLVGGVGASRHGAAVWPQPAIRRSDADLSGNPTPSDAAESVHVRCLLGGGPQRSHLSFYHQLPATAPPATFDASRRRWK